VRYTTLIVWLYQQQAQNHLDVASPQGLAGREIRMMLDEVSLLPHPQTTTSAYQNGN
jgi:hypothetical protein